MTTAFDRTDVERFRAFVEERLGLQFEDGKTEFLADVLRQRLAASSHKTVASYLQSCAAPPSEGSEMRALIQILTVTETYFFRNADHFRALIDVALPERSRASYGGSRFRILSAACASGEEPYSLAMLLRDHLPEAAFRCVDIRGIDVNATGLQKALAGRYSDWSLRETPAEVRDRYFQRDGSGFVLDERIRSAVSFEERNLIGEDPSFWHEGAFDVIFCRNVLMYLAPSAARRVVDRITTALAPGGLLFLGHAETLRGISQAFHLRHTHDTFYYQRREVSDDTSIVAASRVVSEPSSRAWPIPELPSPATWSDVIARSSRRIARLSNGTGAPARADTGGKAAVAPSAAERARPRLDVALAMELLRQERFAEALAMVHQLPAESAADPDTQLFHAVLLGNCGDLPGAERVCRQIFTRDDLNAGAHYLMALCREHAGDRPAAIESDEEAAYLDSGFAMPRLHLGLLARQAGDRDAARRELQHAVMLLAREDSSRILLFGGGFSREALVELCRSELRALESSA